MSVTRHHVKQRRVVGSRRNLHCDSRNKRPSSCVAITQPIKARAGLQSVADWLAPVAYIRDAHLPRELLNLVNCRNIINMLIIDTQRKIGIARCNNVVSRLTS
jgi:hypothetical protein